MSSDIRADGRMWLLAVKARGVRKKDFFFLQPIREIKGSLLLKKNQNI